MLIINNESREDIDVSRCILCQSNTSVYLSSRENGRRKLFDGVKNMPDDLRSKRLCLTENEAILVKYHSVSCYSTFVKAVKRCTRKTYLLTAILLVLLLCHVVCRFQLKICV